MIFRQLFEPESSTYTYLLGCEESGLAVLIDPVLETVARDVAALQELGLTLAATLDTHVHADHITSACRLRELTGSKIVNAAADGLPCTEIPIVEGQPFVVGSLVLHPLFTPGHTDTHHCYYLREATARVFTGDALLIDGCGRTDFQNGNAELLFQSVHEKLFTLPDDTLVYPSHDYQHRHVSTVRQERERNPRLAADRSLDEFVHIMTTLHLPHPKKIDRAVPANRLCGDCPDDAVGQLQRLGGKSVQG
ncbi:MAG: MBL fold metallo-hydrolase [Pseudomonadota bacterium]|nr:MBL fold metallo-hydrolase [Pseudomonadota bacterium]